MNFTKDVLQYYEDVARIADNFLNLTRCCGGRVVAKGFYCPHCGSYDPQNRCDGKIETKNEETQ